MRKEPQEWAESRAHNESRFPDLGGHFASWERMKHEAASRGDVFQRGNFDPVDGSGGFSDVVKVADSDGLPLPRGIAAPRVFPTRLAAVTAARR